MAGPRSQTAKLQAPKGRPAGVSPATTTSVERFDLGSETFTVTGSLGADRAFFGLVRLPMTGKVIAVSGGQGSLSGLAPTDSLELYDPITGLWSASSVQLSSGRVHAAVSHQGHGKVLVTGGRSGSGTLATAETYYGK